MQNDYLPVLHQMLRLDLIKCITFRILSLAEAEQLISGFQAPTVSFYSQVACVGGWWCLTHLHLGKGNR